MNREPKHCATCARFIPDAKLRKDEDGQGHCQGFGQAAHSTDRSCVLFNERDAWATRKAQRPSQVRQRPAPETISRASALTEVPT